MSTPLISTEKTPIGIDPVADIEHVANRYTGDLLLDQCWSTKLGSAATSGSGTDSTFSRMPLTAT
jgi:hypothetical protein